jgi:hypothetical protein
MIIVCPNASFSPSFICSVAKIFEGDVFNQRFMLWIVAATGSSSGSVPMGFVSKSYLDSQSKWSLNYFNRKVGQLKYLQKR